MPPNPPRAARTAPRRPAPFSAAGLAAVLAAGLVLVAGCGQKGPLVLPERNADDVVIRAPGAASAPPASAPAHTPATPATKPATGKPVPAPPATAEPHP